MLYVHGCRRRHLSVVTSLTLATVVLIGCTREPVATDIEAPTRASLDVVSGNAQSAVVGTELPAPLVVRVVDSKGKGIVGLPVEFVVLSGGGRVYTTSSVTNATGEARNYWTLGPKAGPQSVEARTIDPSSGGKQLHGTFAATGNPGAPARMIALADGVPTSVAEGTTLAAVPGVQVVDTHGNAVSGVSVSYQATTGSVVSPEVTITNAEGVARPNQWTIGPDQQTLTATIAAPIVPNVATFTVTGVGAWTFVAAGQKSVCALDTSSRAFCWGDNAHGQLGNGTNADASAPVAVSGARQFAKLAVGWEHACGIEQGTRRLYCWGRNDTGNLGDGTATDRTTPVAVSMPAGVGDAVNDVAAGGGHTCVIAATGGTYCWGYGDYGVLGNGTTGGSTTPVAVAGNPSFVSLAAGISHTCGLTATGEAFCWGFGFEGEIGTSASPGSGQLYFVTTPTSVVTTARFARLDLGGNYTCGLRSVGDVLCWGENRFGQVGAAATATCDGPVPCNPLPVSAAPWYIFKSLSLGRAREWFVLGFGSSVHTCGVDDQARGFCWGSYDAGQLGNGVAGSPGAFQRTPQQVVLPTQSARIKSFAAGYRHTCALSETNQLWCVGANEQGQLGVGSTLPQSAAFGRVIHP